MNKRHFINLCHHALLTRFFVMVSIFSIDNLAVMDGCNAIAFMILVQIVSFCYGLDRIDQAHWWMNHGWLPGLGWIAPARSFSPAACPIQLPIGRRS